MEDKKPIRDKDSGCRNGGSHYVENPGGTEPKKPKEKEKKKE